MGVYSFLNALPDWAEALVRGAQPAGFLNRCAASGVAIESAEPLDDFTLRVRIPARALPAAQRAADRSQCELRVLRAGGAAAAARRHRRRWAFAAALALVLAALVWSKLFLWEITVTGNETLSSARVLDALAECGVDRGSFWPAFTSDNLRSELLVRLPELAWATVNVSGSRAEVLVRERVAKPEIYDKSLPVRVEAEKTGFVTEVRALAGTACVKPGDAVGAGETLISAAAESAFSGTRLVHALGSVRAETYYELSAALPLEAVQKTPTGEKTTHWALVIGKNRWNFYGNSGFCGANCDKMTQEYPLAVPGLFSLPVALVRETLTEYGTESAPRDCAAAVRAAEEQLHDQLLRAVGADGEVKQERFSCAARDGVLTVCLRAVCAEDIAVSVPLTAAEILELQETSEK